MIAPASAAVVFRPMRAEDAPWLNRFHERLSRETTRLRFFNLHPHLTPRELERFTHVDHRDREAIVAWCDDEIIGVGRFERLGEPNAAEVAFVVADEWQGRGIGTQLLQQLITHARRRGITELRAETLPENDRMQRLFRDSGLPVTRRWHDGVVHMALDLTS